MRARVRLRVVEQGRDLVEREAEFPVEQDLLEPVEVGVAVAPMTRVAALTGDEQTDVVVVVQRAHGDPGEPGDLPYGVGVVPPYGVAHFPLPSSVCAPR